MYLVVSTVLFIDFVLLCLLGLLCVVATACIAERHVHYARLDVGRFVSREALRGDLKKRLTPIVYIACNAPYVGLVGTAFCILHTFYGLGQAQEIDTQSILLGTLLALKPTVIGVFIAVPSMMFYDSLVRRAEALQREWTLRPNAHRDPSE